SSRRRHTRSDRDWSSDVCSSDLGEAPSASGTTPSARSRVSSVFNVSGGLEPGMDFGPRFRIEQLLGAGGMGKVYKAFDKELSRKIGRASCRERVWRGVADGGLGD